MHPRRNILRVGRQQFLLAYLIVGAVLLAASVGLVVRAQSNDDGPVVEVDPLAPVDEPGDPAPASQEPTAEENAATEPISDAAAMLYMAKCMGCHTIGGGALTGPDLAPTLGWPRENLVTGIMRMEEKIGPISVEELDQLIVLLQSGQAQDRLNQERERAALAEAATLAPGSAAVGEQLFVGQLALENRGLACAACHQTAGSGGNFAPDLTGIYEELGAPSLQSACEGANFPVMREAYENHPVTKQEARHLVAYFKTVGRNSQGGPAMPAALLVQVLGVVGCIVVFGLVGIVHVKRGTGVRRNLIKQSIKGETR